MIRRWWWDLQYVQWVIQQGSYGKEEFNAGLLEMCMFSKCAIAAAYMVLEGSPPKTESSSNAATGVDVVYGVQKWSDVAPDSVLFLWKNDD